MWKLLLAAAVVCCVNAQRGGSGPGGQTDNISANLTALWQKIHQLENGGACSPRINMMLHQMGPGGHMGPHGHHGNRENGDDSDEHHQGPGGDGMGGPGGMGPGTEMEGPGGMGPGGMGPGGMGPGGMGPGGSGVHIHLHMDGMMGNKDFYHRNNIPWAHKIGKDFMHAKCRLEGQADGEINLRQPFLGGNVEMDFAVGNLPEAEYTVFVHRFGSNSDQCSNLGAVFTPPHGPPGSSGNPHRPEEVEDGRQESRRARRALHRGARYNSFRAGAHNRPEHDEGVLGTMMSDVDGNLHGLFEFDQVTLLGMHSVFARSVAIHPAGDDGSSPPVGCCVVAHTDGSHWGDEEDAWLPGEQ